MVEQAFHDLLPCEAFSLSVSLSRAQPMVEQAFHDLLPYAAFSLSLSPKQLPELPQLLRAVTKRQICEMRAAAARYHRAMLWQQPHGRAYELTMISLCRRALKVRHALSPGAAQPRWASCANLTADDVLANRTAPVWV